MVLLYASRYCDIRTVVNVSGRYDLKGGIVERLGEDFMQRLKEKGYIDVKERRGILLAFSTVYVECSKTRRNFFSRYLFSWIFLIRVLIFFRVANVRYRVTKESMMDRLNTDMHAACLQIDKKCRLLKCSRISCTIKLIMFDSSFTKYGNLEMLPSSILYL